MRDVMRRYLGGLIGLAALIAGLPLASAQEAAQKGHGPITIDSENGIEWLTFQHQLMN